MMLCYLSFTGPQVRLKTSGSWLFSSPEVSEKLDFFFFFFKEEAWA